MHSKFRKEQEEIYKTDYDQSPIEWIFYSHCGVVSRWERFDNDMKEALWNSGTNDLQETIHDEQSGRWISFELLELIKQSSRKVIQA